MDNTKKILNIAIKVVTYLLIAFTVFMMIFTVVSVTTIDKNERDVFGFRFYIVKTDSMSPSDKNAHLDVHFSAGDIIIAKSLSDREKYELRAGDIISFLSMNSVSYGETVTHMIRERQYNKETGKFEGYVTYGTNTDTNDEATVEPEYVLGKYTGQMPAVGNFFAFVKSTPGYIICILIPFLLLILYNGINVIRLFRKYKAEQTEAMEAERAEIAAERKQTEDMLRELIALKEELAKQNGGASPPSAPAPAPDAAEVSASEAPAEAEKPDGE